MVRSPRRFSGRLWFLLLTIGFANPVMAAEAPPVHGPQGHRLLTQSEPAQPGSSESVGSQQLPPGGTSIEDLLLQKGTITMDEWIQIRAEQEYKGAESSRRIDAIEDWKTRTELLPIL